MDFFGIGVGELLLILVVVLLVFGPRKLPEIARGLGKAVHEFKKYSSELTKDFKEEFDKEVNKPLEDGPRKEKEKESEEAAPAREEGTES